MLRKGSIIAAIIGGLGSVGLMSMSGLRPPVFLIILFIGWVLAPFAALVFARWFFPKWPDIVRQTIDWLMIMLAVLSLPIYVYVLVKPLPSQPAFPYVAVPLGSWVLIALALPAAALAARGRAKRNKDRHNSFQ
jgi:phosphate/sulfate permease